MLLNLTPDLVPEWCESPLRDISIVQQMCTAIPYWSPSEYLLQSKLASMSSNFKSVLEERTVHMKEQKSRRDQYSSTPLHAVSAGNYSPLGVSQTGLI